jgi:3''-deamino-3''-oxonicotianamine reductase
VFLQPTRIFFVRNLQTEYVDLYLIHYPISMRSPAAEGAGRRPLVVKKDLVAMDMKGVWEEMECQKRGLAKAIGVSNFSCKKLQYLLSFAKTPPAANQVISFSLELSNRFSLKLY